ncbi:Bifunctional peptidase and (3S)-lysyl hydroxylase Jmjd7 [Pseudocercospora fuligena]|uniref:Bifunctional peptidase and (3S)-lysyl hydroxylase Jmjd7 n=1 Tax=Pseudocercospora fuligena TaxID=685502 RepID=A0A8H6RLI7_9PEZI|nr:Bifunctional peptidase and (3S)-lysyl hydroxylase Jmjd7 [Pseudocercospora fuligena]
MSLDSPILHLISTYHELNVSAVDELHSVPSALEFSRFVRRNRPFVVRNAARNWQAVHAWDARYLAQTMLEQSVNVACTPKGNADAIVKDEHGGLIYVEPYERSEPFEEFLKYVQEDTSLLQRSRSDIPPRTVKYAQTQNDNLRDEYSKLFADVPSDISFATIALEQEPDAINFWLGNERSTTSLHKDNYENIYVQVRGQKHFVLLPPVEMPCVNEKPVPFARYQPSSENSFELKPRLKEDAEPIPVPTWDPDEPESRATEYSALSQPMRISLNEGDMFYLPAMWYHKVSQSSGFEGFSCSVNYWYDMSFEGSFWAQNAFLREVYDTQTRQVAYPAFRSGEKSEDESDAPSTS